MTIVHIVLAKIKADVTTAASDSFKEDTHKLGAEPELKPLIKEMVWGPPVYDGRTKGFDWGLYSTFESREQLEKYRNHPVHLSFVDNVMKPNTEDLLAYDFEV